jgi:U32 family peptidase
MKILSTLHDIKHFDEIIQIADGIIIGHEQFAAKLTNHFNIGDINELIKKTNLYHKTFFLQANQMMNDQQLDQFEDFIKKIDVQALSGIIVCDLGAIQRLKKLNIHKAIYYPDTLLTNTYDFNFSQSMGAIGAFVAKEITLEDIVHIGKNKQIPLFMLGHGHLSMFYSKRTLVTNYIEHTKQSIQLKKAKNLSIVEEHRVSEAYPILEDEAGTHVFNANVFASINEINTLRQYVDYLVIDTIFKSDQYALDILNLYVKDPKNQESVMLKYNEVWHEGFLHKKTIYMQKESYD